MKITSLQILVENLIRSGFVFENRAVRSSTSGGYQVVEVGDTGPLSVSTAAIAENSVNFYLEIIRQGKFSWLLFDASLVQIWYRRRGDAVVAHRYCYIPAPFDLDLRREQSLSQLSELIEGSSVSDALNQARKTALRFEYDPYAQTQEHPAAHLHLNVRTCRIPMRSGITVREFTFFLVHFLYSENFDAKSLGSLSFASASTLSDDEEKAFHLNWRLAPGGSTTG